MRECVGHLLKRLPNRGKIRPSDNKPLRFIERKLGTQMRVRLMSLGGGIVEISHFRQANLLEQIPALLEKNFVRGIGATFHS